MSLCAYVVRFGEPRCDFAIDFSDVLEAKGVEMIPRRECLDPTETWVFQAPRENDMAVHPISPNDESSEAHADLESDPRFFGENDDRPVFLRQDQQAIEDRADLGGLSGEMGCERRAAPAGVRLISIRKLPPALRAAPHWGLGFRSSDRSSDNGRGRSGN